MYKFPESEDVRVVMLSYKIEAWLCACACGRICSAVHELHMSWLLLYIALQYKGRFSLQLHSLHVSEGKMQGRALLSLLGVAFLLHCSYAHVRLTFPPARFPDYDFLDNVRTGGPCGIPGTIGVQV